MSGSKTGSSTLISQGVKVLKSFKNEDFKTSAGQLLQYFSLLLHLSQPQHWRKTCSLFLYLLYNFIKCILTVKQCPFFSDIFNLLMSEQFAEQMPAPVPISQTCKSKCGEAEARARISTQSLLFYSHVWVLTMPEGNQKSSLDHAPKLTFLVDFSLA